MISKNLCFKIMKEDLKRRVWTVSLLMLSFFFVVLLPVIYRSTRNQSEYSSYEEWMQTLRNGMLEILGEGNPFVVFILVIAALVCAISGFSYLHSAKKVDFYHSLPVKRGTLFMANFINGILMTAVIYLAALIIGMLIAAGAGVGLNVTAAAVLRGYAFHMAYFCLLYTITTAAMMLTGNFIIALLGNAVLCFYGPCVAALLSLYLELWLKTYSYESAFLGTEFLSKVMTNTSPFINYMVNMSQYNNLVLPATIAEVLLIAAVLAVFCGWLYAKRPSEAAGRAMAFQITMTPIKFLVVIPVSLAFGAFFWALGNTMGWAVFGILCGGIIVHCLMEIIYHFDFRKLFCHKVHLIICVGASLIFLCGFKYDWFGYDSYLPKEGQVKSASISMKGIDNWVTYGNIVVDKKAGGEVYYDWEYSDMVSYSTEHMKLTDIADIIAVAQKGIQFDDENEMGDWERGRNIDTYTIQYTLNSGRKVMRSYRIHKDRIQEEIARIFASPEYKAGVYPLLSETAENISRINFQQFNHIAKVDVEAGSPEQAKLLSAYQKDLSELTMEARKKEIPIATIQFLPQEMDEAIYRDKMELDENEYRYRVYNLIDRCYYPVYASFTRTLELLDQYGVTAAVGIPADIVSRIDITHSKDSYNVGNDESAVKVITDRKEIEAIAPALIYEDYFYMNSVNETIVKKDIGVTVYIETGSGQKEIVCFLDAEQVPDILE